LGRRTAAQQPNGDDLDFKGGQLVKSPGSVTITTNFAYDAQDNQVVLSDPFHMVTTSAFNSFKQPTQVTDAKGKGTTTLYDRAGNVTSVTDPGKLVTTFRYNPFHQQITKVDPVSDEEGAGGDTGPTTYQYDPAGNLTAPPDRDNRLATYAYDPLGRRTAETWFGPGQGANPGGRTASLVYGYDATSNLVFAQNTNALP